MVAARWDGVELTRLSDWGPADVSRHCVFFFQAEDGIRDAQQSRGLGDVYKRQIDPLQDLTRFIEALGLQKTAIIGHSMGAAIAAEFLSLIHI